MLCGGPRAALASQAEIVQGVLINAFIVVFISILLYRALCRAVTAV